MANNNAHYIFYGYGASETLIVRIELRYSVGDYQIRAEARDDGSTWSSSDWVTLPDEPHTVELEWQAATASGANNGVLRFWVDDTQQGNITNIDNDTRLVDYIKLGAVAGVDTGTRGTEYFDAFESRRESYIGLAMLLNQPDFVKAESKGGKAGLARLAPKIMQPEVRMDTSLITVSYAYDSLYRLTAANYSDGNFFHYTYDAVGNKLTETTKFGTNTYVYDAANRLVSVNAVNYTWDNNGNLLSDGEYTYTYDHANRLKTVTDGVNTRSYSYNGLGDRVSETVNEVTTDYVLDLAGGLTQVLAEGTNSYLYGNARIMQEDSSAEKEYFLGDALGSVRMLTDEDGEITLLRSYEPYGEVLTNQGSGETSYAFTGEQYDTLTGLVYLRARYYSTASGRFMSRDAWQGDQSIPMSYNAWLYGYGNPVRYTDPSGWIAINEDKTAKNLVNYLYVNYSVNITIDWGYVFNIIPHPAPGDHGPASCWNEGLWSYGDLNIIRYSVETFARSFPTIDKFKKAVGPINMLKKYYACGRGCTSANKITFLSSGRTAPNTGIGNIVMNTGFDIDAWTVVHEMGHVWDNYSGRKLSRDLEEKTGGHTNKSARFPSECGGNNQDPGCNDAGYFYGGKPAKGSDAYFNIIEDFAESVAAYIFPIDAQKYVEKYYGNIDYLYYSDYTKEPRWEYINSLIKSQ